MHALANNLVPVGALGDRVAIVVGHRHRFVELGILGAGDIDGHELRISDGYLAVFAAFERHLGDAPLLISRVNLARHEASLGVDGKGLLAVKPLHRLQDMRVAAQNQFDASIAQGLEDLLLSWIWSSVIFLT